ncbi:MAG TPA: DUF6714 family protein [Verrucomicrobiae bacterium]
MTNDALIKEIGEAFSGVPKPQTTLRVARGADDHDYDWKKLQKLDEHYYDWEDVPDEDLDYYQDIFYWLCPQGFQFYLPAYMSRMLRTLSSNRPNHIWPMWAFGERCFELNLFELFTRKQTAVTVRFLEVLFEKVKDDYHADWWNHFDAEDWDDDELRKARKLELWEDYGAAYQLLKAKLGSE